MAKTLAGFVISFLVVSFAVFALVYIAPGDPLSFLGGGSTIPPHVLDALREQYGLDDPFLVRYFDWLTRVVRGDLGTSIAFGEDVTTLLRPRAVTTLYLVVYAGTLAIATGLALGTVAALRGGAVDRIVLFLTTVGIGTPTFVGAIILASVFAVNLDWFPALGQGEGFFNRLYHLTLPAVALAIPYCGIVAHITRTAVRGELGHEHVETARSRGLSEFVVVRRHVLRNALIPISTTGALITAGLISGAVVVEKAFGIEGLGSYLVDSVERKDFAIVQAIALLLLVVFISVNTIVDLVYGLIDPRVRANR